jgi:diaminopimelate epimerase
VKLVGGDLTVEWDEDTGHVFMTGPAEEVFSGEIDLDREIDLSRWQ